jgi:anti-sigma factor RsiW
MINGQGARDRCEKALLVQAEIDGELTVAQAADLVIHRAHCPMCRGLGADLVFAHGLLHSDLYQPAPDNVRERVLARLALAEPQSAPIRHPHWLRDWRPMVPGIGLGAACAAVLALFVLAPDEQRLLTDQVIAGHVRALQPGHLEDVASSDRHTVKPWFDGRLDFAPPVKDFGTLGFPLIGGRLDYIHGRPVSALVYRRDSHIINLFVWPTAVAALSSSEVAEQSGYNVVHWTQGGMTFWAVSDLERGQLTAFASAWQQEP